jgi:hypothetical protein
VSDDHRSSGRRPCLKAFGVAGLLGALGLLVLSHLYGVSLRAAGLIKGKGALRMAYQHMLERGYPTNFGNPYTIWINTNVIELNGTNYRLALSVEVPQFYGRGVLSMTTNEVFVWQDERRGPKLIPPGYRPPLFPPVF